jgi:hypothetical protein
MARDSDIPDVAAGHAREIGMARNAYLQLIHHPC